MDGTANPQWLDETVTSGKVYIYRVLARDKASGEYVYIDGNPDGAIVKVGEGGGDTTPPDTTIISYPSDPTASTTATFKFVSSETGSTFECQLDGGGWTACTKKMVNRISRNTVMVILILPAPYANLTYAFEVCEIEG